MDVVTAASLIISIVSLLTAAYIGIRQYTIQRNSNSLPATFEILAQLQRRELHDGFEFIATELKHYSSDGGLTGLPPEAKAKVLDVCYFLQHVAMLALLDIVDERAFVAFSRTNYSRLGEGGAVRSQRTRA